MKKSSAYEAISEKRMDQVYVQIAQYFLLPSMFDMWRTNDPNAQQPRLSLANANGMKNGNSLVIVLGG